MAVGLKKLLEKFRIANYVTIRHSLRSFTTTSSNMEKALENLKSNPYYEKYASRIADLQKTSPEEFMQRVEVQQKTKEEEKKKKFASVDTRQFSSVLNPKQALKEDTKTSVKKLNDIFKIDLVKDKDAAEIITIWEEYHKSKEVISATIPKDTYTLLQQNMQLCPTFLFPLPRAQGYEFIMCQSYGHTIHFTPLLAYQNVLDGQEAQCLANQFQMYYSGKDAAKLQLLQTFTKNPDTFKHMDLIAQLENIGL
uniref:ATP synthase mitochondrial F1 complex assembly factor 1 n=1 Tax=Heliothis virescens TaxID=7102 RepID=A0A2A4JWA1_HELVI